MKPPEGYESWLDWFLRPPVHNRDFDREQRAAARAELAELRRLAEIGRRAIHLRNTFVMADSELSAVGYGRPPSPKGEMEVVWMNLREFVKEIDRAEKGKEDG